MALYVSQLTPSRENTIPLPQVIHSDQSLIIVEIGGAVIHPGVYELPADSRVVSLVEKAGGISRQADQDFIQQHFNQAESLQDGQKVYVPFRGEDGILTTPKKKTSTKKSSPTPKPKVL